MIRTSLRRKSSPLILRTEGDGLASATIDGCDYTVMIPMAHGVDSLNVAAARCGGVLGALETLTRPEP